jgi:UDP-glucose 4-epimerase
VDDLSTGRITNLSHVPAVDFVQGDLAEPGLAASVMRGVDYVFHEAAIPSVPRSVADPVRSNRANVDSTLNVLVAARDAGVRRLVFAGSSSVYGSAPGLPKDESMPTAPRSPYAVQKLAGEQYCQLFYHLYGLETVVTRYFNVFGPRQDPGSPYSGVISLFITALAQKVRPTVHGDGAQTRDFTYVGNVVDGVLRAATASDVAGEVVNVATGHRVSLLELLEAVARQMGVAAEPVFSEARSGDVRNSHADISKARLLLGYEPVVPFDEGLRRTVAWYCESLA